MQKRGLILLNAYADGITRQAARLRNELISLGVNMRVARNNEFIARIQNGETAVTADVDFCVYLDKDKYVARMLEKSGVRLFNRAQAIENCDDKMTTHIILSNNGIPMPDTVPGLLCYDANIPLDVAALDRVEAALGYPVVVKLSYGSMGKGVFKADNRTELVKIAETVKPYPHLFQKYIKSSHGTDMRVIVAGGKVLGGIIRRSNGDFRSNIGLGGSAKKTVVPKDVAKIALRAADILKLDYCGMDFLLGDTPLLCEVNSNAFFDAFEQATGINVARAYAEHIVNAL